MSHGIKLLLKIAVRRLEGKLEAAIAIEIANNHSFFFFKKSRMRGAIFALMLLFVYFAFYLFHTCEYYLSILVTYYGYLSWVLKYSSTQLLSLSLGIKLKETLYMV